MTIWFRRSKPRNLATQPGIVEYSMSESFPLPLLLVLQLDNNSKNIKAASNGNDSHSNSLKCSTDTMYNKCSRRLRTRSIMRWVRNLILRMRLRKMNLTFQVVPLSCIGRRTQVVMVSFYLNVFEFDIS